MPSATVLLADARETHTSYTYFSSMSILAIGSRVFLSIRSSLCQLSRGSIIKQSLRVCGHNCIFFIKYHTDINIYNMMHISPFQNGSGSTV